MQHDLNTHPQTLFTTETTSPPAGASALREVLLAVAQAQAPPSEVSAEGLAARLADSGAPEPLLAAVREESVPLAEHHARLIR